MSRMTSLTRVLPWSVSVLVPVVLAGCSQSNAEAPSAKAPEKAPATAPAAARQAAAKPAAKSNAATRPTTAPAGKGSWYLSTNTAAPNWSKTGLWYEKEWEDHVDAGDNTTLELYVKALSPHTIEVFNAKKISIGMLARAQGTHAQQSAGVTPGSYVQLIDQNWTKVSIPLADFKNLNVHDIFCFPALPQALGTGDYALGVDEIRFVGGTTPVVWYGEAHPKNPITIHGPGMDAHYVPTGGVDTAAAGK